MYRNRYFFYVCSQYSTLQYLHSDMVITCNLSQKVVTSFESPLTILHSNLNSSSNCLVTFFLAIKLVKYIMGGSLLCQYTLRTVQSIIYLMFGSQMYQSCVTDPGRTGLFHYSDYTTVRAVRYMFYACFVLVSAVG